jgi:hypothetical protein
MSTFDVGGGESRKQPPVAAASRHGRGEPNEPPPAQRRPTEPTNDDRDGILGDCDSAVPDLGGTPTQDTGSKPTDPRKKRS